MQTFTRKLRILDNKQALQEIEKLRRLVRQLKAEILNSTVKSAAPTPLKIGEVQEVNEVSGETQLTIKERNVDETLTQEYTEIRLLPNAEAPSTGENIAFGYDRNGKMFALPAGSSAVIVKDIGDGTAKNILIDENGNELTPAGQETLDFVVAERTTQFHNATPPTAADRVYLALKREKTGTPGEFYYIVFLPGYGPQDATISGSATVNNGDTLTIALNTDNSGLARSITVSTS